jgi:initiation factor 1A
MVQNITGGKNTKKQGRKSFRKQELIDKIEDGQMFAQLVKNEGNHFFVLCSDNVKRCARMSGRLRKGPKLAIGSFVIVSLRDFEANQDNCDIIGVGNPPNNIINLFKKNNPTEYNNSNIDFVESDEEFQDFEESTHTTNVNNDQTTNDIDDNGDFAWEDI